MARGILACLGLRTVVVYDPDRAAHEAIQSILRRDDRDIRSVFTEAEALAGLENGTCNLLIAADTPGGSAGRLMQTASRIGQGVPVILTGESEASCVLSAIRRRAYSYFHQPPAPGPLADMAQLALDATDWTDDIRVVSGRREWVSLEIRCKLTAAERTAHFFRELQCDLPAQTRDDTVIAVRELLMNSVEHGGKSDPALRVRVSILRTSRALLIEIEDPGPGFSMDVLPHAAISNPDDSPIHHVEVRAEHGQRPGGFGIMMTRSLVDELIYNERGNAALVVKYL